MFQVLGRHLCGLAIERTQLASVTLVRPAAHLTGHIFNTTNHISSGLRPRAFVDSGVALFTWTLRRTTPWID